MGRLRHARTYNSDERGIAYGARAPWSRSAHSSRGTHDPPGRAGKPSAGRRGTGDRISEGREVCVMQIAEPVQDTQPWSVTGWSLESPVS